MVSTLIAWAIMLHQLTGFLRTFKLRSGIVGSRFLLHLMSLEPHDDKKDMRKLFLLLANLIALTSFAEVEMDTIYYDKDWKGVSSPSFATYYRIVERNPQEGYQKRFRDYYISGELQSEGGYISIDKFDDANSIMHGEWTNYYKSGKVEQKGKRINGKQEGEYIRFFENGSIAMRANFKNDKLDGLYTEFNENGLCFQQEFINGIPKYDYYVVSTDNGLYSKIRTSDNTPIFTSPSLYNKKVEYRNGEAWPYYLNDGIMIAMTNTEVNDYGKYYRIYINLTNNSLFPIEFDPSDAVAILTDKKGKEIALEVQTAQQYDKRIRRTQMWEEALVGFANGLAAANAGYSTSTTTSSYSGHSNSYGSASAYGTGGYAYGSYSGHSNYYGSSTSTTRTYDAGAAYQAQLAASQNMAYMSESNYKVRQARQEGYLKRTTIRPGESISGYFNIKRKKGDSLVITLNIAGAKYQFPWNVNH